VVGIGRARVYVGAADRFDVRVFDLSGRPTAALRRDESPTPVSRADVKDEIERAIAEAGEPKRLRVEQEYAEITLPTTLPAYTDLVIDADDQPWVRAFPRRGESVAQWSVFAATGALVAEVAVPKHLEVYEIGRDYVLGRYMDPSESIPQVRLYRLVRSK